MHSYKLWCLPPVLDGDLMLCSSHQVLQVCLSAGNQLSFYQLRLWASGINQKQNFHVFLSGKAGTLCGLVNWEHLQGFSSQRWDRTSGETSGVGVLCRATSWKLLEDGVGRDHGIVAPTGSSTCTESVESLTEHCSISGSITNPMQRLQFPC